MISHRLSTYKKNPISEFKNNLKIIKKMKIKLKYWFSSEIDPNGKAAILGYLEQY